VAALRAVRGPDEARGGRGRRVRHAAPRVNERARTRLQFSATLDLVLEPFARLAQLRLHKRGRRHCRLGQRK